MKFSILICTLPARKEFLDRLLTELNRQISEHKIEGVEILTDDDQSKTVGAKRNSLLHRAQGDYLAFVDDDDMVSNDYVSYIMEILDKGEGFWDCLSLKGVITWDGKNPEVFQHTILCDHWHTKEDAQGTQVKYFRPPNHLNVIKSAIAKRFSFPDQNFGEDQDFSMAMVRAKALHMEYATNRILYYYLYRTQK